MIRHESRKRCFATLTLYGELPPFRAFGLLTRGFGIVPRKTGSAAAPSVAFPAERLAAARGFGIMTGYLEAGRGAEGPPCTAHPGRGRQKCTDAADGRMDGRMRQTTEPLSRLSGKEEVTEPGALTPRDRGPRRRCPGRRIASEGIAQAVRCFPGSRPLGQSVRLPTSICAEEYRVEVVLGPIEDTSVWNVLERLVVDSDVRFDPFSRDSQSN